MPLARLALRRSMERLETLGRNRGIPPEGTSVFGDVVRLPSVCRTSGKH